MNRTEEKAMQDRCVAIGLARAPLIAQDRREAHLFHIRIHAPKHVP